MASKLMDHKLPRLHRAYDQVCRTVAKVGAQARHSAKVINDRSEGSKILHMWVEESNHIICVDGGMLSKTRGS
jgi:hypothetical protein